MRRRKGIEQRAHPRYEHKQAVTLTTDGHTINGETVDVSLMGMFVVATGRSFKADDEVELTLRVGSAGGQLTFVGKVVRAIPREDGSVGLAFLLNHTINSRSVWSQHLKYVKLLGKVGQ